MSDWNDIENLWRSNEPPEIGHLAGRLRRQTRLLAAWVALEVALGLGTLGFGLYLTFTEATVTVGLGVVAFAAFGLNRCWNAWRGAFRVETGTPADTIASALARNAALKRYVHANYLISAACVALIAAMVLSGAFGRPEDGVRMHRALVAVTIGFGVLVFWLVGFGFYAERITRERERLLALKRAFGLESD